MKRKRHIDIDLKRKTLGLLAFEKSSIQKIPRFPEKIVAI